MVQEIQSDQVDQHALEPRPVGENVNRLDGHPHLLRHSFATRLAEKQVHPSTIQDLMNHADLSQLTRYVTVADPSKRAAVELLDEDF